MAIPTDKSSTVRLTQYARYHLAALKADPQAEHLVGATQQAMDNLSRLLLEREATSGKVLEARARFDRADFELDEGCRLCELEVLGAMGKNREASDYRALFAKGLSTLVAARGETQLREVQKLAAELEQRLPEIARKHGPALRAQSERTLQVEKELGAAEDADGIAFNRERIARTELVRQLQRNQGALRVLYPNHPRRIRSFFPQETRRPSIETEPDDLESSEPAPN